VQTIQDTIVTHPEGSTDNVVYLPRDTSNTVNLIDVTLSCQQDATYAQNI